MCDNKSNISIIWNGHTSDFPPQKYRPTIELNISSASADTKPRSYAALFFNTNASNLITWDYRSAAQSKLAHPTRTTSKQLLFRGPRSD